MESFRISSAQLGVELQALRLERSKVQSEISLLLDELEQICEEWKGENERVAETEREFRAELDEVCMRAMQQMVTSEEVSFMFTEEEEEDDDDDGWFGLADWLFRSCTDTTLRGVVKLWLFLMTNKFCYKDLLG
jgi:hypothetical protein